MLGNDVNTLILFSLILMRMSGFILLNPILGRKNLPMIVKSGFIMVLSIMVYSFHKGVEIQVANSFVFAVLLLKEFAVGYLLGFVMQLFLFIVTYAGEIMDFQMGLSMASVYDAQSNAQIPVTGQLFMVYFMLLFFATDGHLALMKILITSSEVVEFGGVTMGAAAAKGILEIFVTCIVMAVKFAFPLLAVEFLAEVGVGILMKVIPQINIFSINIQVKLIIGFVVLLFLFSPMSEYLRMLILQMIESLRNVLLIA